MNNAEAIELIDAHLDRQPLTDEQSDALTAWITENPRQADEAFYRIFLHSYLRTRLQAGLLPATSEFSIQDDSHFHLPAMLESTSSTIDRPSLPVLRRPSSWIKNRIVITTSLFFGILGGLGWWGFHGLLNFGSQSDQLYAYEGFDYPGTVFPESHGQSAWPTSGGLQGLNKGIGWSQPWQETNSKVAVIADYSQPAMPWLEKDMRKFGPLGYTDSLGNVLQSSGNQMRTATSPRSITTRLLNIAAFPGSMRSEHGLGLDGSVIWLSFLAQSSLSTADNNRYSYLMIGTKETSGLRIGKLGATPSGNWTAAALQTGAEVNLRSSPFPSGEMVFFVARIIFRPGPEEATVWINPRLDTEPQVEQASMRLPVPDFRFDGVAIHANHSSDFDELRIGGTFQSIAPVTEPRKYGR